MLAKLMTIVRNALTPLSLEPFTRRHESNGTVHDHSFATSVTFAEVKNAHEHELERARAVHNAFALIDAQVDGFRALHDRRRPSRRHPRPYEPPGRPPSSVPPRRGPYGPPHQSSQQVEGA